MRRVCDAIWIIDLGGEGRGTRQDDNVFAIQTPVAIGIAVHAEKTGAEQPARVFYTAIEGSQEEKLAALEAITTIDDLPWEACPDEWQAPFRPAGEGNYFTWPLLTDLMPWQHSGSPTQAHVANCPYIDTLKSRWRKLLKPEDRAEAFKETSDRRIDSRLPARFL